MPPCSLTSLFLYKELIMSFIIRSTSAWNVCFSALSRNSFISATLNPSSWIASSSLKKGRKNLNWMIIKSACWVPVPNNDFNKHLFAFCQSLRKLGTDLPTIPYMVTICRKKYSSQVESTTASNSEEMALTLGKCLREVWLILMDTPRKVLMLVSLCIWLEVRGLFPALQNSMLWSTAPQVQGHCTSYAEKCWQIDYLAHTSHWLNPVYT